MTVDDFMSAMAVVVRKSAQQLGCVVDDRGGGPVQISGTTDEVRVSIRDRPTRWWVAVDGLEIAQLDTTIQVAELVGIEMERASEDLHGERLVDALEHPLRATGAFNRRRPEEQALVVEHLFTVLLEMLRDHPDQCERIGLQLMQVAGGLNK